MFVCQFTDSSRRKLEDGLKSVVLSRIYYFNVTNDSESWNSVNQYQLVEIEIEQPDHRVREMKTDLRTLSDYVFIIFKL